MYPVLYNHIFHFQQGVIRSAADVRPYLRADRKALGGSVKREKNKHLWNSRERKNTSTLVLAVQDGFEFRGYGLDEASMLLRLWASPTHLLFMSVVDRGDAVTDCSLPCSRQPSTKTIIPWQCPPC